jgi:hypothetical protein
MGFSSLRSFGPQLIHHTQLKIRTNTAVTNLMLVDSPGMIDSPMVTDPFGTGKQAVMHRGYDFEGVCKWYADRADVILLFFDPDKPGTTGETLQVLTSALTGLDHKLHIILNKSDQFRKIHDFARAYGSLCWNLSKVIQRKDLPRIHTMCLPPAFQSNRSGDQSSEAASLGRGLIDLEATRDDVVREVLNAPKRRVDNEITRLAHSIALLQMHCTVVDDAVRQYRRKRLHSRLLLTITSGATLGAAALGLYYSVAPLIVAQAVGLGAIASGGLFLWQRREMDAAAKALVEDHSVERAFRQLYSRQVVARDEYVTALWSRVHDHLRTGLSFEDIQQLERLRRADRAALQRIVDVDLPALRRGNAPAMYSSP